MALIAIKTNIVGVRTVYPNVLAPHIPKTATLQVVVLSHLLKSLNHS